MKDDLFCKNFQEDKRRVLDAHGYDSYEQFLRDKDAEGLSTKAIGDIFGITCTSICHEFRLLGMPRGPRGGKNNYVIPDWGIDELAGIEKLTATMTKEYACMFLCSPQTVRVCHRKARSRC